jgi:hypothetical protein
MAQETKTVGNNVGKGRNKSKFFFFGITYYKYLEISSIRHPVNRNPDSPALEEGSPKTRNFAFL